MDHIIFSVIPRFVRTSTEIVLFTLKNAMQIAATHFVSWTQADDVGSTPHFMSMSGPKSASIWPGIFA